MEFLSEYGLFLLKAITIVLAIIAAVGGLMGIAGKQRNKSDESLELTSLNDKFELMQTALKSALLDPQAQKLAAKAEKKKLKAEAKANKKQAKNLAKKEAKDGADDQAPSKKRLFVLDFDGDIKATPVDTMREEISALLTIATEQDEVLLRLESGGGAVHSYGLAASQLQRIKDHNIPLTVSVDRVAASGGYLMACVADKIIAAPFSIIGSIGVIAQIPNFHRLLKKNDIDIEQITAGKYKRTVTMLNENTDEDREKMREELEEVHTQFKTFVSTRRPDMDIEKVATGEHWLGERALELGLVDTLQTSDDYLMAQRNDADILLLEYAENISMMDKISERMSLMMETLQGKVGSDNYPKLM
ncbi:MAG: protease SohB [Arenicellales bacterium]